MLKQLGVKKGDRVAIYMPMIIELVVSMLACARIGAMHSIVVSCLQNYVYKLLFLSKWWLYFWFKKLKLRNKCYILKLNRNKLTTY